MPIDGDATEARGDKRAEIGGEDEGEDVGVWILCRAHGRRRDNQEHRARAADMAGTVAWELGAERHGDECTSTQCSDPPSTVHTCATTN